MKRDEGAQLQVLEALIVGVVVFIALALTAIFRLPTTPSTFQSSELEGLGSQSLLHLLARPPPVSADCNEPSPCPFANELERMISLALAYEGPAVTGTEGRDVDPLRDYLEQALPEGSRYVLSYSNGINATTIHPVGTVAPALDVVVSHAFLTPNWTAFSANLANSVLLRIGELTEFKTTLVTSVTDPLDRTKDEWGHTQISLLSDATETARVPNSALYGTYKLCPTVGACAYFTVVPPGIFAPGAVVLGGDRDNSTSILYKDDFFNVARFQDGNANDLLDTGERLYLEFAGSSTAVNPGDLRLSSVANCVGTRTCPAGTYVKAGDADQNAVVKAFPVAGRPVMKSLAGNNNGRLDEGEGLYLDVNNNGVLDLGERRLARFATYGFGSEVALTDQDFGRSLISGADLFTAFRVLYADSNLNNALDPDEPCYLDLVGNGQVQGLESFDVHLSQKGSPTVRYLYDIRAVIWYGI